MAAGARTSNVGMEKFLLVDISTAEWNAATNNIEVAEVRVTGAGVIRLKSLYSTVWQNVNVTAYDILGVAVTHIDIAANGTTATGISVYCAPASR